VSGFVADAEAVRPAGAQGLEDPDQRQVAVPVVNICLIQVKKDTAWGCGAAENVSKNFSRGLQGSIFLLYFVIQSTFRNGVAIFFVLFSDHGGVVCGGGFYRREDA
jgi:hypothetical protein